MNRFLLFTIFLLLAYTGLMAQSYPPDVAENLIKASKNRYELEKVINYFRNSKDSLKLKAAYFLIANMDIHYSNDYFWADSTGKHIEFSELDYPDFATAIDAFEQVKLQHGKVKPVAFTAKDINTIKADFLIENIELAFEAWGNKPFNKKSFDIFCEYVLPYRTSTEPLQPWRKQYKQRYLNSFNLSSAINQKEYLLKYALDMKDVEFVGSYAFETRKEPLSRLGAQQLLLRKKGACEDLAAFKTYAMRSHGVPAAVAVIPYWATASAGHFFTVAYTDKLEKIALEPMKEDPILGQTFYREPSKILITTFSKQKETLASFTDIWQIPPGIMRVQNYKDVTSNYWPVQQIVCKLYTTKAPIVYASVFNYMRWKPTWWGKVTNNTVTFTEMPQGVAVLPMWYANGRLQPAGYPVIAYGGKQKELKPDLTNRHNISLSWQDKYLVYRLGSKYKLYYWDNTWKLIKEKTAEQTDKMDFDDVPKNALLLLKPDYSNGKERPFIITDKGERVWW